MIMGAIPGSRASMEPVSRLGPTGIDPERGRTEDDPFAGKSALEQDLILARMGDYPGAVGCKRIAASHDALLAACRYAERFLKNSTTVGAAAWVTIDVLNAATTGSVAKP